MAVDVGIVGPIGTIGAVRSAESAQAGDLTGDSQTCIASGGAGATTWGS